MTCRKEKYDVIVVGSGGSGSAAAETAVSLGLRVLLISKDPIVCSDSKISEGIITVRASHTKADTEAELANNLRVTGDDLGDPSIAEVFAKDSQPAYAWLQNHGIQANIDSATGKPKPIPIPMGGHTLARSVDHKNGGLDYGHACWNAIHKGNIDYLEDAWFLDLYTSPDDSQQTSIAGGLIYHASSGEFISVSAPSVVLACGGLSTLYFPNTDTMRGNTGDAYAIAARAGAKLVDMEQVQFIPFAIANSRSYQGLVVGEPISAGVLGTIKDRDGNVLMSEVMGRTRAECSAVIARAVADGKGTDNGGCYLDLTENSKGRSGRAYVALMQEKIPGLLKTVKGAMGHKAARFEEMWEVRPSAHYLMGGIKTTPQCEVLDQNDQIIEGLYAAGQAMGGLHGSNRLGSTSLAEGIIFGCRAGTSAGKHARNVISKESQTLDPAFAELESKLLHYYEGKMVGSVNYKAGKESSIHLQRKLQKSAWAGLGPARTQTAMNKTLNDIDAIKLAIQSLTFEEDPVWNQEFIDYLECANLLLCAEAIAKSALNRSTSLGAHVRLDERTNLSTKFRQSPPYSVECIVKEGNLSVSRLTRERSPWSAAVKLRIQEKAKIAAFKAFRKIPEQARDKILFKIYSERLDSKDLISTSEDLA